jgi:hypothetical protein
MKIAEGPLTQDSRSTWFATSFLVGLFQSQQHAGLSRRSRDFNIGNRSSGPNPHFSPGVTGGGDFSFGRDFGGDFGGALCQAAVFTAHGAVTACGGASGLFLIRFWPYSD